MSHPRIFRVGELEIRFHLDPAASGGTVAMFESVIPPGAHVPAPHRHLGYDETIHALAGVCHFQLPDREVVLAAGGTLFVPRGLGHGFVNRGPATVHLLVVVTPGLLGPAYFEAVAEIVNVGGPPDRARLVALMAQHGMTPVTLPAGAGA
jgi:quercetin dioxygenase-like cupin family protein